MNDFTILLTMVWAPAFLMIGWAGLIEFDEFVQTSGLRAYVQSHSPFKPVHR